MVKACEDTNHRITDDCINRESNFRVLDTNLLINLPFSMELDSIHIDSNCSVRLASKHSLELWYREADMLYPLNGLGGSKAYILYLWHCAEYGDTSNECHNLGMTEA